MQLLSSFRAQMVFFVAAMILLITIALQIINQRLERRITISAEEQFNEVNRAIDIALNSFPSGRYLYDLVNSEGLAVTANNTIHNIIVVNENREVIDSTKREDLASQLRPEIAALPLMRRNDSKMVSGDHESKIEFPVQTDKGTRTVIVVISLQRLAQTVSEVGRLRLLVTAVIGLLSLLIAAYFSSRFTRPVTELARAARRVTAGDLEFQVNAAQRNEVGTLSRTFNEMLVELRRSRDLEDQLQRAQRSAVVGRLASGIAHEIRNPLNFMNLSIDHLQSRFIVPPRSNHEAEAVRNEAAHILGLIKDEIGRLNRLVSDFLSYGRPAKLKIKEINARSLVEEVIGIVRTQAEQQGVKIKLNTPTNGDTQIEADAEQIKTCFSNLIINAIQAMPDGGELNIYITSHETMLQFEFQDTGHGIAATPIEQIFEPYYSTKETGIGLGLPLTKKLIEDHGGEIKVHSELSRGTTFTVTLPREAVQKADESHANSSAFVIE
ncbi:MAG: HAMP domain-containing protein [Blastocatellia bacterium]|nr:HAMP domain-containing protein [Blastocatellia bacterium]